MIQFSGISLDPNHNKCHIEGCKNGACTSVWNHPTVKGRVQTDLCGWHLKELYEEMHSDLVDAMAPLVKRGGPYPTAPKRYLTPDTRRIQPYAKRKS